MTQPGAKLIRPDDPGHGVTFERFSEHVLNAGLAKVEAAVGISWPCDEFRNSLICGLWDFYLKSLPEAAVTFERAALKKELQSASRRAYKLGASAGRIWRSRDPAIVEHLARFGAFEWSPGQPLRQSGVALLDLLYEFELTTKLLADTLDDDPGGPRSANAFGDFMIWLEQYHCTLTQSRKPSVQGAPERARDARLLGLDFFRFAASVLDVLRKVEGKLPAADFKLPKDSADGRALRERLRRLRRRTAQGNNT